ncbi:uncharacterized protein [Argopecten irradians]|uniref:uncharacterized protein isoform X2 n=1 Tax=Argopecten irradians TaxID=31199 RepID=UPI003711BCBE
MTDINMDQDPEDNPSTMDHSPASQNTVPSDVIQGNKALTHSEKQSEKQSDGPEKPEEPEGPGSEGPEKSVEPEGPGSEGPEKPMEPMKQGSDGPDKPKEPERPGPERSEKPMESDGPDGKATFALYSKEEVDAIMIQARDVEGPEIQDAAASLLHESKFPLTETHRVTVIVGSEKKAETLVMDHGQNAIHIGDQRLKSYRIRFAHLNRIEDTSSGFEVAVSYIADDHEIRLLHIMCSGNPMTGIAALNSFRRMFYKFYKDSAATVQEFQEIFPNTFPVFTGSLQQLSIYNLETQKYDAEQITVYVCMDRECLMILESQFSEKAIHRLYFWTEATSDSVDKVLIMHEINAIHIQTQKVRLEIPQYTKGRANEFFQCIRRLKPEHRGRFTDIAGQLHILRYKGNTKAPQRLQANMPSLQPSVRNDADNKASEPFYTEDTFKTNNTRLISLQGDLENAVKQLETQDEIALPWVIAEDEINRMLVEGIVPESDVLSGGLDPNNIDHFMKCIEAIELHLVQQDYEKALSRLQGTKKIFRECNLCEMQPLLRTDDIVLLKQMYFHSFT